MVQLSYETSDAVNRREISSVITGSCNIADYQPVLRAGALSARKLLSQ